MMGRHRTFSPTRIHRLSQETIDDDQKAGAAARVEAGVFAYIFHRQFLAVLIAEDGLVLGSMVHEHPLDVAHVGNQRKVEDEDGNFGQSFQSGQRQRVADVILEKADQRGGQKGKEEQRHRQREQQDAALQEGHKFISEQLTQFLLKFGWLFRFFVQSGFFGSFHQTFVAIGH